MTRKETVPRATKLTYTGYANSPGHDKVKKKLLICKMSDGDKDERRLYSTYPPPHRGRFKSYRPVTSLERYRKDAASVGSASRCERSEGDGKCPVNARKRMENYSASDRSTRQKRQTGDLEQIRNGIELMTKIERRTNSGLTDVRVSTPTNKKDNVRALIHGNPTALSQSNHHRDILLLSANNKMAVPQSGQTKDSLLLSGTYCVPAEQTPDTSSGWDGGLTEGDIQDVRYSTAPFMNEDYFHEMSTINNDRDDVSGSGNMKVYNFDETYCNEANVTAVRLNKEDACREAGHHYGRLRLIHPVRTASSQPAIHLPCTGVCKGNGTTMTTTLPRITPACTPLPPGLTQRSHSCTSLYNNTTPSTYGAYPPKDLSNSMDFLHVPNRVNPLNPPPPRKRINWSWETTDPHFENEKRRLLMQKREYTRYHSAWSKPFYGAPAEKESYRRHFREVLKQQMHDKDIDKKVQLQKKVKETERAIQHDVKCLKEDAHDYHKKHVYLMKYRDGNKHMMERIWTANKERKTVEDRVDCERLRYNPINWSCSLK